MRVFSELNKDFPFAGMEQEKNHVKNVKNTSIYGVPYVGG